MTEISVEVGGTFALPKAELNEIISRLHGMGYQVFGPVIQDNVLAYNEISGTQDLPRGYTSRQDGGRYTLVYSGHPRYFDITPGAQSWKQFFFPPRAVLFSARREDGAWQLEHNSHTAPSQALIGVRPCELAGIHIQDRVFLRSEWSDRIYRERRQRVFILSVDCLHPCGTCFCDSMGTGPESSTGYDINLTELDDVFLVKVGSEAGRLVLTGISLQPASAFLLQSASKGLDDARRHMGRSLPDPQDLPRLMLNNLEHPEWNKVAARCLGCTSCTQVCPTCFCWDAVEQPSLDGNSTQRVRVWDSCFNPDYSYVVGGNTRGNTRARYRQWLTHKLGSWKHQFGVIGCVGCGHCITWCPAGIDLTEEVAAIRKEKVS